MTTPKWLAASSNQPAKAGQINQFLVSHATTYIWSGAVQASETTAGTGGVNSDGLWVAQKFTTGASQTAVGRVLLTLAVAGSPTPLTVGLYANSGSSPSGAALVTTMLPKELVGSSAVQVSIPLPATVTPSTVYWIVAAAVGDASDYFTWDKSNQASGASTSPDGVTWTAQAYGLLFEVVDQAAVSPLAHTWSDAGQRWRSLFWAATGEPAGEWEFTQGQTPAGYAVSACSMAYSNGLLTTVT